MYQADTFYKQSEGFICNTKFNDVLWNLHFASVWFNFCQSITLKPCDCIHSTVNYSTYYSNIGDMFGAHINVPVKPYIINARSRCGRAVTLNRKIDPKEA